MVITSRNSILSILIVLMFIAPAMATSVSITIWGTNGNASGAQQNVTKYGANNSVNISAWNVTKTVMVKSLNASGDTIAFNISNMTAYRVYELKVNGTAINGYQAGANGMLNFSYAQNNSNVTYSLSPAVNTNGYNMTWAYLWHLGGSGVTTSGTYSGDDSVNRAIPHSLGRKPLGILYEYGNGVIGMTIRPGTIIYQSAAQDVTRNVTAADDKNFYVGVSPDPGFAMNGVGNIYYWIAW